jgi:small subunit ribosomal protein S6
MKSYELTYIISSQITSDQAATLNKEVELFVQGKGGVILKSEKKAPQSLAYPIKKHSSGYITMLEFQGEEKEIKGLKAMLEKEAQVLRHFLTIKKPFKKMKERRTRKPLLMPEKPAVDGIGHEKKKEVKVELGDIEKKLDEILSE